MRILLATAVAIAPLMAASGAMAEVVISTARTTPITTANATGSGPDNIRLASAGAINLTSGVAVTVNSSHDFDMDSGSSIGMVNTASGSTGVLINGGNTADITIGGSIGLTDDITSTTDRDTDNDGDDDGDFANGTDRYGVRLTGAAPLVGNILVESTGEIGVDGNNSYGISLEAPLTGDFHMLGAVELTGNDGYGIRVQGDVSGDVVLAGTVGVRGENTVGVSLEGDIAGALVLHSRISSTGYRYGSPPETRPVGYVEPPADDENILLLDELDADDLLQGGPALSIQGNVAGGVILALGPVYVGGIEGDTDSDGVKNGDEDDDGDGKKNREDTDRDGDGIPDASEVSAALTSFGGAPAIEIGSATRSITLGAVGAGNDAYGFISRGAITAQGLYDGVAAQGLVLGGNAGQTVDIAGGVRIEASILATSLNANATAVHFGDGVTALTLFNSGNITAGANSDDANTVVTAIQIDAGATVNTLINSGTILASAVGGVADTFAIRDLSGGLVSITNTGVIQGPLSPNADNDPVTGIGTAIDVSANMTGVTLVQSGVAGGVSDTNPDTDGDGVPDSAEPNMIGAIRFGGGDDVMDIRNGAVVSNITFGDGADTLSITGGATVRGIISDSDGALDINVTNGTLEGRQVGPAEISNLDVGANGDLIITVDPANGTSGGFNVSGTATLADGAGLGVRFGSLLVAPDRFTLIDAATLN